MTRKKINKLNLLYITLVITLFLFSNFVSAEELPGTTNAPVGEITTEMTFEQFSKNPTPSNFGLMNAEDQSRFIASINTFQNPNNEQIAVEYFINSENVNENKDTFVKFMEHKGVNLDIADGKGVVDFSKEGTLTGANGEKIIDIYKFSNSKIGIKVDEDGNVILIDNGEKEWNFQGDLSGDVLPDGKTILNIQEGTFDGKEIINGKFNLNDGVVRGTADSVLGVTFNENEDQSLPEFEFNREENKLTTANANIEKIDSEAEIAVYGENIKLPNNDLIREGGLVYENGRPVKVMTSSDVVVQGFNHITRFGNWFEEGLDLYYAENDKTLEIDRKENEELKKIREDGLGKGTKVTFSEMSKEIEEESTKVFELQSQASEISKKIEKLRDRYSMEKNSKEKENILIEMDKFREQLQKTYDEENDAKETLQSVTDKYLPLILKKEKISKKYQNERQTVYDTEIIPDIKKSQSQDGEETISNYFVYGNKKVWLGGQNFETKVEEGNDIFPEFVKRNDDGITRIGESQLEFHPDGAEIEIEKISRDNQPLALFLDMNGKGKINNGKYEFLADGDEIKGRTLFEPVEENTGSGQVRLVSSDMRFQYSDSNDKKKTYDLDVDTKYFEPLTDEKREELNQINIDLNQKTKQLQAKIQTLEENPKNQKEFKKVQSELNRIDDKLLGDGQGKDGLLDQYRYQQGQLARAVRNPDPDSKEQAKRVNLIENEMEKINREIITLEKRQDEIIKSDLGGKYYRLNSELSNLQLQILDNDEKLLGNLGQHKTGAFGQIVSSDNGDAKLSYQEYIEGHPVLKNDYVLQFTREVYRPEAGVTVGGERLTVPEIYANNQDSLDLNILNGAQECIDTQFRTAYDYALETGQDICYDNGRTCLRDRQFKGKEQKFIEKWMSTRGTKTYANGIGRETKRAGSWDKDLQIIPPNNYDQIQPGDVLLLDGHAIGIKEVVEIPPGSGEKYFKQFAGSMPAISAHVYEDYISVDELKKDKKSNRILSVYRWKFKGDQAVVVEPTPVVTAPVISQPETQPLPQVEPTSTTTQPVPQLEPISAPIDLDIDTPDLDLPELEFSDDDSIELPIKDDQATFDLPDGKIEVDSEFGEFSEPGQTQIVETEIPVAPEMPEVEPKTEIAQPKEITTNVPETFDVPDIEYTETVIPELEELEELEEIEPVLEEPTLSLPVEEEMISRQMITPELINTNPIEIAETDPNIKKYTGSELFSDNARCPECTYWIDPATGDFKASQLTSVFNYKGEKYPLYREFKLTKRQIRHLEKAKEKGKIS